MNTPEGSAAARRGGILELNSAILAAASVVGGKEREGPLGRYVDFVNPGDRFGQDTWESAESEMQRIALAGVLGKAHRSEQDVDLLLAGDLLNQCAGSAYGLLSYSIPYLGLYGACSTSAEGLLLAAALVSAGFAACADTQAMNVPASQYDAIAQALSRYFAGKADTPQAQILKGGALASAFNEKELQHLSDVRRLFQSLRALGLILMIAVAALMLTACALAWRIRLTARTLARTVLLGWAGAMVLIGAVALWAAVDFNSLFVLLHRLLFSNELWLMDPQTDLIILLMPESFFVLLSAQLGWLMLWFFWPLGLILAALLYFSFKPMKSGEPT